MQNVSQLRSGCFERHAENRAVDITSVQALRAPDHSDSELQGTSPDMHPPKIVEIGAGIVAIITGSTMIVERPTVLLAAPRLW